MQKKCVLIIKPDKRLQFSYLTEPFVTIVLRLKKKKKQKQFCLKQSGRKAVAL